MADHQSLGLRGARAAADAGDEEVARWVAAFLASRGNDNAALAAALAREPHWWYGPVALPIHDLERVAGPEDDALCTVGRTAGDGDVGEMEERLEEGWEPPPVIVEWRDGRLLVQDGNQRHDALLRAGATEAWALIYFPRLVDRDQFAHRHLELLRMSGRRP